MARKITISLSDALEARLQAEAEARGSQSLEDCSESILAEMLEELERDRGENAALEAEILKGLDSPARALSDADWEKKKADLVARRVRSKAG